MDPVKNCKSCPRCGIDTMFPCESVREANGCIHRKTAANPPTEVLMGSFNLRTGRTTEAPSLFLRMPRANTSEDAFMLPEDATEVPAPVAEAAKPTNPKDALAVNKLPLNVVPASMKVYAALAFVEGEAKYGGHNWRVAGVRASVYKAAMERHMEKWWNGEDADPKTGVPHLANIMACAAIILDAKLAEKLTDDRPPSVDYSSLMDGMEAQVASIRAQFADKKPRHFTIADTGL